MGSSAVTAAVYTIIAFANLQVLLPCSIVAGLVFGAHWALMPATTADLFGPRHFAANQSIMHLSTAIGALLLSTELAGTLFERRGRAHGDPKNMCIGPDCFRSATFSSLHLVGFSNMPYLLHWLLSSSGKAYDFYLSKGRTLCRAAYITIGGLALLQTVLSAVLLWRSRPLYWQLHIRLRRLEAEAHS